MAEAAIWVEPLGEPSPPPDAVGTDESAWGDELRRELEGPEDWVSWATERMIPAAQAAYRVAGVAAAIALRAPIDRAWEVWATEPDEVRPVVAAILPAIPRTPLARFIVGRLPGAAAVVQGAGLALDRIRATRELRTEGPDHDDRTPAGTAGPDRERILGVGSIPYAAEPDRSNGRRGPAPGVAEDEPEMDRDRPSGGPLDGTVASPTVLRTLLGTQRPGG